jgi:hypothetical protein
MISDLDLCVKEHPISHDGKVVSQALDALFGSLSEALFEDEEASQIFLNRDRRSFSPMISQLRKETIPSEVPPCSLQLDCRSLPQGQNLPEDLIALVTSVECLYQGCRSVLLSH